MNSSEMIYALKSGKCVYGTLIVSTSPKWPEAVKNAGVDFIFIDAEHMPMDRNMLSWMCQTYKALNIAPLVRISSPDPYEACMALDGGASGIIVPYVETPEQVEALRGAVKLRPLKGKRLQKILEGKEQCEEELNKYLLDKNKDNLLIVNIESKPAVQALDDILKVPQLDAVLIGPHDLSCSLGIPEQYRHPLFDKTVRDIIKKARSAGVAAGIHYFWGIDQEISWVKDGLNMVIHSSDMVAFSESLSRDIEKIKRRIMESDQEIS